MRRFENVEEIEVESQEVLNNFKEEGFVRALLNGRNVGNVARR